MTYRIFWEKNLGWDLKYTYPLGLDWIIKSGYYITVCSWKCKFVLQEAEQVIIFFIKDYKYSFFFRRMYTYDLTWVIILLHFPWYCADRSGCLLHLALRSAQWFRYVFPSEPHTGPLKVTLEQSGAHTQRGLFRLFILHLFPAPQSTLSQVSVESIKIIDYCRNNKVMNNWSNELTYQFCIYKCLWFKCHVISEWQRVALYLYTILKLKSSYRLTIKFKTFPDYFQTSKWWKHSNAVPLQGMQFGAPPLKISHRKSVLLGTSSSVHAVPKRPLLQQSSRLIPDMYRSWHLPFLPCWSQQLPAGKSHCITSSYMLNTILLFYHSYQAYNRI